MTFEKNEINTSAQSMNEERQLINQQKGSSQHITKNVSFKSQPPGDPAY